MPEEHPLAAGEGIDKTGKQVQTLATGLDPYFGMAKVVDCLDGTSNTIIFYECVGMNEKSGVGSTNNYPDPLSGATPVKSSPWRWANPEQSGGVSVAVNANRNGGFGKADLTTYGTGCAGWEVHDCPNSEVFSFHQGGAHVAFGDGHVVFLRDTMTGNQLKALATRSNKDAIPDLD